MRFNKKEMLTLALQPSHKFDKEGILFIKEKQEGFFKRTERNENPKRRRSKSLQELYCYGGTSKANFERWCRLRGNLLFYMKSRDQWSEPAGVIIIQNCTIKLDHSVFEGMYGFYLVFDHGASQHIATRTQYERDLWLEAIQVSSYDTVRSKLLSLQEKLEKKQSYDPDLDVNMWRIRQGHHSIDVVEVPICEVSLACDNLLCDGNGRSPRPVLIIQVYIPTEDIWLKYANTEVVEKSSNPVFLKTVCFWPSDGLSNDTLIQIKAFDVREKVSGLATPLGSTKLYLSTLLECTHPRFRVQILSSNNTVIGFLTLTIWRHERDVTEKTSTESTPSRSLNSRNSSMVPCHRRTQSLPPRFTVKQKMPHQGHLQVLYANAILSTYRFHSGLGGDISVHEIMAESKLCFYFPQQLLEVWMLEEKELLQEVAGMGELVEPWNSRQLEVLDTHLQLLHLYSQAKENLRVQRGSFFKASSRKGDRSLEFAPINLHLQRMWAQNDTLKKSGFYDIITVGAFTAHSHRSNNGGLIRLVQQVKELAAEDKNCVTQSGVNKITMAYDAVQAIKLLRREVVDGMGSLLRLAKRKETHGMLPVCEDMMSKTRILLSLWDSGLVEEALAFIEENKLTKISAASAETEKIFNMSPFKKIAQHLSLISKNNTEEPATMDSPSYDPNLWRLLPQISSNKIPSCPPGNTQDDGQFVIFPEAEDDVISSSDACNTPILDSNDQYSENKRFLDTQAMCSSPSANYYKPTEEPEPWDLTQLNIEASVMCLVSKVKFLCGRCNSPAVRLRTQNSVTRSQSFRREMAKRHSVENTEKTDDDNPGKSIEQEGNCSNKIRNKFTEGLELNSMLDWAAELKPSMRKLRQAMDGLLKTARLTHSVFRIQQDRRIAQRCCNLRYRRHVCFSQALTSVVTALMTKFWCLKVDPAFLYMLKTIGPLASFEGLLTYYGDEVDMWGDMVIAIEDLTTVTFALVLSSKSRKDSWPRVVGSRSALTVLLPIPESLQSSLSLSSSQISFRITPVFFNIGINEMATLAESLGTTKPQQQSNIDNFDRLNEYYYRLKKLSSNSCLDVNAKRYLINTQQSSSLGELLERLKAAIHSNKSKNIDVLQLSAEFCRRVQGLRFITCKSAKDRTSMAVTLDQCLILQAEYDLAEHEFQKALDCMRSEGTRRQNTFKNVGVRKYAFNSIQILPLPKLYRPPSGTYGSTQT